MGVSRSGCSSRLEGGAKSLSEINELTTAFEGIQASIQTNSKLYEVKLGEYEGEIISLREQVDAQLKEIELLEQKSIVVPNPTL